MVYSDFNKLSLNRKEDITWEKGQLLCTRQFENYRILLFSLDHFYIEAWLKRPDYKVTKVYGFKYNQLLFPYLDQINIEKELEGYR